MRIFSQQALGQRATRTLATAEFAAPATDTLRTSADWASAGSMSQWSKRVDDLFTLPVDQWDSPRWREVRDLLESPLETRPSMIGDDQELYKTIPSRLGRREIYVSADLDRRIDGKPSDGWEHFGAAKLMSTRISDTEAWVKTANRLLAQPTSEWTQSDWIHATALMTAPDTVRPVIGWDNVYSALDKKFTGKSDSPQDSALIAGTIRSGTIIGYEQWKSLAGDLTSRPTDAWNTADWGTAYALHLRKPHGRKVRPTNEDLVAAQHAITHEYVDKRSWAAASRIRAELIADTPTWKSRATALLAKPQDDWVASDWEELHTLLVASREDVRLAHADTFETAAILYAASKNNVPAGVIGAIERLKGAVDDPAAWKGQVDALLAKPRNTWDEADWKTVYRLVTSGPNIPQHTLAAEDTFKGLRHLFVLYSPKTSDVSVGWLRAGLIDSKEQWMKVADELMQQPWESWQVEQWETLYGLLRVEQEFRPIGHLRNAMEDVARVIEGGAPGWDTIAALRDVGHAVGRPQVGGITGDALVQARHGMELLAQFPGQKREQVPFMLDHLKKVKESVDVIDLEQFPDEVRSFAGELKAEVAAKAARNIKRLDGSNIDGFSRFPDFADFGEAYADLTILENLRK